MAVRVGSLLIERLSLRAGAHVGQLHTHCTPAEPRIHIVGVPFARRVIMVGGAIETVGCSRRDRNGAEPRFRNGRCSRLLPAIGGGHGHHLLEITRREIGSADAEMRVSQLHRSIQIVGTENRCFIQGFNGGWKVTQAQSCLA